MTSNATCDANSASWVNNSQGDDPCHIYARLQSQCIPEFGLKPLTSTSFPYEPTNNACGCNVVAYNLMAACTWCQSTTTLHNWWGVSFWTDECRDVTYNPSELPASVSFDRSLIPSWALAVPTRFTWLPYEASAIATPGGQPSRSTATDPNSSTSSSTTVLSASSASSASSSNSGSSGSVARTGTAATIPSSVGFSDSNASNVAGAAFTVWIVIVLVVLLVSTGLCIVLAMFYIRRRRRRRWAVPTAEYSRRQTQGYSNDHDQYPPSIYPNAESSVIALTYVYEHPGSPYLAAGSAPSPMTTMEDFQPPAYQDELSTPGTGYYGGYAASGQYVEHSEQVAWGGHPLESTPSVNGGSKVKYAASSDGPHTPTSTEKRSATSRLQATGSGDNKSRVVYK